MTKDKDTLGSAIFRAVADTGLTTAMSGAGTPGGPVVSKAVKQLILAAEAKFRERNARKFENWLHEVATSLQHASSDTTVQLIEGSIDKPWVHGPLEDVVRAIRDGIDEKALAYLARLAAWQLGDHVSSESLVPPSRRPPGRLRCASGRDPAASDRKLIDTLAAWIRRHGPCRTGWARRAFVRTRTNHTPTNLCGEHARL